MSSFTLPYLLTQKPTLSYQQFHLSESFLFLTQWIRSALLAIPLLFPPSAFSPTSPFGELPLLTLPSHNFEAWLAVKEHQRAYEHRKKIEHQQKQVLIERISSLYLIAQEPSTLIVETAYKAARQYQIDPVVLLAIIAVESRFNPYAQSVAGALGLAQIIPRWHPQHIDNLSRKGLEEDPLNPISNIYLAGAIYREYLNWHSNNHIKALQQYNGALHDPTRRYSTKVMRAYRELAAHLPPSPKGPTHPHPHASVLLSP